MNASGCKCGPFQSLLIVGLETVARIKVREAPVIIVAGLLRIIDPKSTMLIMASPSMIISPRLLGLQDQINADPRLIKHLRLYIYMPRLALAGL